MMKLWKNRLMGSALAGVLTLGAAFGAVPVPRAEAGGVLVDVLGTAIAGTMYRDKVMGVYKTYNNTDKGRQEWFEQMKKEEYLSQIDEVIAQGPYTDTWDSLCEHPTPKWYARDKFGIFIHWGVYSG